MCDDGVEFSAGRLLLLNPESLERTRVLPDKPLSLHMSFRSGAVSTSSVLFAITSPMPNAGEATQDFGTLRMLSTGQLAFTADYGGAAYTAVAPLTFDDGEWHSVSVVRTMQEASLVVDGGVSVATAAAAVSSTSDEWKALFLSPRVGTLLGSDVGPPLQGLSQDTCARRCIDEEACLSFDFTPARVTGSLIQASTCSLNSNIADRTFGGLTASENTLHYELRSPTAVDTATVVVARADTANSGGSGGSGDVCDMCVGGLELNNVPSNLAVLAGQSLDPCPP